VTSTDTRQPGEGWEGPDRSGRPYPDVDPPTQIIPVVQPDGEYPYADGPDDAFAAPGSTAVESPTTALSAAGSALDSPTTAIPVSSVPPPVAARPGGVGGGDPNAGVPAWRKWVSPAFAVIAVALLPVAAMTTNLDGLNGWGLVSVLSWAGWAALGCAVAACVAELWMPRSRIPMLGLATGVLVLCSTGMPSVVQPQARFTTAWLISGFVDAIAGNGTVPSGIDARFYWPAFFAQWAFFRDAGGVDQLDAVLRWFPPAVVLVWAIGVYALARSMLGGTRAPWVACWLFVGLNWIEQDYFSPQATGIVLMLTVLTFALGPLATRRTDAAGVANWPMPHRDAARLPLWRRWLVAALTPPNRPTLPARQVLLILFCTSLCLIAVAPTHQLTPFAIIGQLVLLAIVGRFHGRGLVIIALLAVTVYVLIAARDFWLTQLNLITGSGEDGAVASGILDRLEGDTGQITVKLLRIVVPGATWLLAIAGAWVYWKRRRDLVPIGLAVVPMAFAAVQSYGGELFLRIVLYGLPILTILGVDALRALVRRGRSWEKVLAVGMALTFVSVVVIRGGNDAYSNVTTEDVQMTRAAYAATPPGLTVMPFSAQGPYGLTGWSTHSQGNIIDGCTHLAQDPLRCVDLQSPDVILFYKSIEEEGIVLRGQQPGWTQQVIAQLVGTGRYRIDYQNGFDAVLRKVGQ